MVDWVPSCDLEDSTEEEVSFFVLCLPYYQLCSSMLENVLLNGAFLHLQTPDAYEKAWETLKVSIKCSL